MNKNIRYEVVGPNCKKGKVFSDSKAEISTCHICCKCQKAFIINWKTLVAVPSPKIPNTNNSN